MGRIVTGVAMLAAVLVNFASPAAAAPQTVVITCDAACTTKLTPSPDPEPANDGDQVTFANHTSPPRDVVVCVAAPNPQRVVIVPAGKSAQTPPLSGPQTLSYYLVPGSVDSACTSGDSMGNGTIQVAGPPTTTTTSTAPTTTSTTSTTAPTTTTARASTTTTSTSSTTTTSTTSTTAQLVTASGGGGGSSHTGTALLLGAAAIVVAGLAALAFIAYRRSQNPPFEGPAGWGDYGFGDEEEEEE